jgi:hypothetical protein
LVGTYGLFAAVAKKPYEFDITAVNAVAIDEAAGCQSNISFSDFAGDGDMVVLECLPQEAFDKRFLDVVELLQENV